MMEEMYISAYWGILISLVTLIIQAMVASIVKAAQKGAVPGKIDETLSHSSFVFRAQRTFMNSLENVSAFLGAAFLAVLVGADVFWTGTLVWIFACSRIIHMILYYAIATEKNPSPRSLFYLIGVVSNIVLLILCGITLA